MERIMRLDKFLKNSRLIKRRTLAKEACEKSLVEINNKLAKPSDSVNIDDIISLQLGERKIRVKVKDISDVNSKKDAETLYDRID
ncbi:S4 domain protein [Peptoniphilus harei]|nr:S4 domain protein [Peptoniphilus harei]